jgi:hypothetical protein
VWPLTCTVRRVTASMRAAISSFVSSAAITWQEGRGSATASKSTTPGQAGIGWQAGVRARWQASQARSFMTDRLFQLPGPASWHHAGVLGSGSQYSRPQRGTAPARAAHLVQAIKLLVLNQLLVPAGTT